MHAQMMPTLISMVDQFAASAWSQVGFVELEKEMRVWRRMMEMTVTLVQVRNEEVCGGEQEHLQGTDEEHQCDAELLLPRQFQLTNLPQRQGEHPYI
jgi:hypothetical protein